jgi:hypothetical protein
MKSGCDPRAFFILQGMKNGSVSNLPFPNHYLFLFVIPSEAEGPAVLRTFPGNTGVWV